MSPARPRLASFVAFALVLAFVLAVACPAPAHAQPTGGAVPEGERLGLELNRLEPRADLSPPGCRAWLVLRNPADAGLDPLRLDLVLFERGGVIARRLVLDVGPLPASKTTVRVFDLAGLPCPEIGAVLLNDLPACGSAPTGPAACLPRVETTSRVADVRFER